MNRTPDIAEGSEHSNPEIRRWLLQYFYDRNAHALSARGKKGTAARISEVRKALKSSHGLSPQEVWSNMTYLLSKGWVEEEQVQRSVLDKKSGVPIPRTSLYYKITAQGIDQVEVG